MVLVPFGTAFWGSFTVSYGFSTQYWVEWRNLGISNAVTTVVLVPAFLLGAHYLFLRRREPCPPARAGSGSRRCVHGSARHIRIRSNAGGSQHFARALICADSSAHLGGAPLRPWWNQRLDADHYLPGDLGNHARARPVPGPNPRRECDGTTAVPPATATPLMLLAVVIEEERRSKEALRESGNLMGLAAEAGNLAMWVWDVSGNDVWMTERGRSLFGLKPDARLDFAATFDRVHPEDRAARENAIKHALETRGEYEMEYRVQQADGVARWVHGSGRCVGPDDGTGPKLFGVSMDVTARKQAEASAAQKRAELEHVARVATLGELTATLTHELGQPLAAIRTNSSLGVRLLDAPEPDLQEVRSTLADICEATEHAGEVIGRLRAMLKRDSTAAGLTNVDVNHAIRIEYKQQVRIATIRIALFTSTLVKPAAARSRLSMARSLPMTSPACSVTSQMSASAPRTSWRSGSGASSKRTPGGVGEDRGERLPQSWVRVAVSSPRVATRATCSSSAPSARRTPPPVCEL